MRATTHRVLTRRVRESRTERPAVGLLLGLVLVLGQLPILAPAASAARNGIVVDKPFTPVVTNELYDPATGQAYADYVQPVVAPRQRLLYTIDTFNPGLVAAYDLDTFKPVSRKGLALQRQLHAYLVDDRTGGLAVVDGTVGGPSRTLQSIRVQGGAVRAGGSLVLRGALGDPAQRVVGMTGSEAPGISYLLSASIDPSGFTPALIPGSMRLSAVDLRRIGSGQARVLWSQPLPNCRLPALSKPTVFAAAIGYEKSANALYFGCSSQGTVGVSRPPDPVGIGRVALRGTVEAPQFDYFELFPKYADFTSGAVGAFDHKTGRLIIEENTAAAGTQFDAFDGLNNAYVGSVGAGKILANAWGLDPVHSRFYSLSSNPKIGLLAFDVAPTPLAQGQSYPKYTYAPGVSAKGVPPIARDMAIAVDPKTSRLFIHYTGMKHVTVFRDEEPYFHEPRPPDPDANTVDIRERPGKTGHQFAGSAQGYGVIYRQVGGTRNLQFNVVPVDVNGAEVVGGGTRELTSAYIGKLNLDGAEASAAAIADDRDAANTGADMAKAGVDWPYQPAACADFGSSPRTATADGVRVKCDAGGQQVEATARGGASSAKSGRGPFDIGVSAAEVTARASLDRASGMTTSVSSRARGISVLGGLLRIGQVTTRVETRAQGRPGTARSTFHRSVEDVTLGGRTLCGSACRLDRIAAQVNSLLAGRVRIDFPTPDAKLAKGSPGGYQALVKRTRAQQIQEVDLNQHPTNRSEVPGLAVTIYQDNTVPSRTLAYFAGVAAESYYGIYRIGSGDDGPGTDEPTVQRPDGINNGGDDGRGNGGPLDTVSNAAAPPPLVDGGAGGVVGSIKHGIQVIANGIERALRLFGVWGLLLVPVYLSARRWLLLSRGSLPGGSR